MTGAHGALDLTPLVEAGLISRRPVDAPPRAQPTLRERVEAAVEDLIALLDAIDGDADIEEDDPPEEVDVLEDTDPYEPDGHYLPTSPWGDRLNQDPADDLGFRRNYNEDRIATRTC